MCHTEKRSNGEASLIRHPLPRGTTSISIPEQPAVRVTNHEGNDGTSLP